jgi:hypothetical protein
MKLEQITLEALVALFEPTVRPQILSLAQSNPTDKGLVVFENIDMSSPNLGQRSVMVVGPSRTYKTIEECEGQHLGDVPSRFQYATKFWRKEGRANG